MDLNGLPKAPAFNENDLTTPKTDQLDQIPTPSQEAPVSPTKSDNEEKTDIPFNLVDTQKYMQSQKMITETRMMASIYAQYAEKHELPPYELLKNDNFFVQAIQDAVITRANDANQLHKMLLKEVLEKGDASDKLNNEDVKNMHALFNIASQQKEQE